jgi:hypothetical protein
MSYTLALWQTTPKDVNDLIVQASDISENDAWQPFPIGMHYNYKFNYSKGQLIQQGPHSKTVFAAFNEDTDARRRPHGNNRKQISSNLKVNNIQNIFIDSTKYFESLPDYKFVVSPEGNGIDCHRTYEALIAGCIPIVENNPDIKEKYNGCPILYTYDYSEITEEYLNDTYVKMLHTEYDFSKLFLSYYSEEERINIKKCGNYWMQQTVNENWYN